jgi:hypothetical protein
MRNLILLEHLLHVLSLIRNKIGSLPIFVERSTAALGHYAGYSTPILPFPLKLYTLIAIDYLSSICLGSFCVAEPMLD